MPFVSYAQNFEDVILNRALNAVAEGFYVDVGAEHPENDSVTRAFYERGWRGINVEPDPAHYVELKTARPRDLTLQLALGERPGQVTFYDIPETGLSTTVRAIAEDHRRAGRRVEGLAVVQRTLDDVLDDHAPEVIHFLKIDVEGAEAEVLRGASFKRHRPWIVLVEATAPNSRVRTHDAWEGGLLAAGYRFAYDDGLNRFYVAQERSDLLAHFADPPNIFDDFVRAETIRFLAAYQEASARAARSEALEAVSRRLGEVAAEAGHVTGVLTRQINQAAELGARFSDGLQRDDLQSRINDLQSRIDASAEVIRALQVELESMRRSTSWRLTGPVRWAGRLARRGVGVVRSSRSSVLARAAAWLEQRPRAKRAVRAALVRVPGLHRRLRARLDDVGGGGGMTVPPMSYHAEMLTDQGRWWFDAIERRRTRRAS